MRRFPVHALIWTQPRIDRHRAGDPQTHGYRLPDDQLAALVPDAMSWTARRADGRQVVITAWRNDDRFALHVEGEATSHWGEIRGFNELWSTGLGGQLDASGNLVARG